MIAEKFIDRFARNSGIKDKLVAEREVVLTYALNAIWSSGAINRLAFKGGTALRKLVFGQSGRFSMDLDFTLCVDDDEWDDALEQVLDIFTQSHHGIHFNAKAEDFYFTDSDTSFGGNVPYTHDWNKAGIFKLQISLREKPTLPLVAAKMLPQEYFKELEFEPFPVQSLATIEMISEKVRAAFQRSKVRDLYDLNRFAVSPFDPDLLRGLVVLKLWQSKDPFDPDAFFMKITGSEYDWKDLYRLVSPAERPSPEEVLSSIEKRYTPLRQLTGLERELIADSKSGRNEKLAQKLRGELLKKFSG